MTKLPHICGLPALRSVVSRPVICSHSTERFGHAALAIILIALGILACTFLPETNAVIPSPASQPAATLAPVTLQPTTGPRVAAPTWWPTDLGMPKTAEPTAGPRGQAKWTTPDTNVDGIRDYVLREATGAGYQTYTIALSPGSIYDLLLVRAGTTYALNITQGSALTILTGKRVGTMHFDVTGAVNASADLPLREYVDISPTSEIAFGTAVPSSQCLECEYLIYVHVAPFNGPGVYQSKPAGTFLIDAQLNPGGNPATENYQWAQQCTVLVPDALSGSFACAGLENVNDSSKRLNVSGKWQQPPPIP